MADNFKERRAQEAKSYEKRMVDASKAIQNERKTSKNLGAGGVSARADLYTREMNEAARQKSFAQRDSLATSMGSSSK